MGKKGRRTNRKKRKFNKKSKPFVSICTPTFNRRPFIPYTIQCYLHQDYPRDKLEWIIIDDGNDPIEDLVKDISGVKYFKFDKKMTLGKKRNLMHEKSKGDIIVYMDDDDYYPPERVSHAVSKLVASKRALCAGASEIHIWFKDTEEMIQFGPYGPQHATAGTFAFKRELLKQTSYEETASLAEEKHFLKNYTIPFVQLNPRKTILVFSHEHNTFDKRTLLKTKDGKYVRNSQYTIQDFIQNEELIKFFTKDITALLENYELGKPKYKPDVIKQTKELKEKRMRMAQQQTKDAPIMVKNSDGIEKQLNNIEIVELLTQYQQKLKENNTLFQSMKNHISEQDKMIKHLQDELNSFKNNSDERETINFTITEKKEVESTELDHTEKEVIKLS